MSNATTVISATAAATIVNAIHTYQVGGWSAVPKEVFGAAGLLLVFAGIGQFLDWGIAIALAMLHLLATMLTNGAPAIDWLTRLFSQQEGKIKNV